MFEFFFVCMCDIATAAASCNLFQISSSFSASGKLRFDIVAFS